MKKLGAKYIAVVSVFLAVASPLSSCSAVVSDNTRRYDYVDTAELSVTISNSHRYSQRDGYELELVSDTVTIEGRPALSEEINAATEAWMTEGQKLCDKLRAHLEANYESDRYYSVGCYVTHSSDGLLSVVGKVSYTEAGETNSYVFESGVWELGAERAVTVSELLTIGSIDYENWLTENFYPVIQRLSAYFPQEISDAAGAFSEVVDYYLEPGAAIFYLKYADMRLPMGYATARLSFSDNPHMFRYRVSSAEAAELSEAL